jgi:hypothetical protein
MLIATVELLPYRLVDLMRILCSSTVVWDCSSPSCWLKICNLVVWYPQKKMYICKSYTVLPVFMHW